jgi:hypothetical protein
MIKKCKLKNNELLTILYKWIVLALVIKALNSIGMHMWLLIVQIMDLSPSGEMRLKVVNLSNFIDSVILPLISIVITYYACVLFYRLIGTRQSRNEGNK